MALPATGGPVGVGRSGEPAPFERERERRLRLSLGLVAGLGFGYVLARHVLGLPLRAPVNWLADGLALGVALLFLGALVLARRGRGDAALLIAAGTLLALAPVASLLFPTGANLQVVLPFLALAFVMNFTEGRALAVAGFLAWLSGCGTVALVEARAYLVGGITLPMLVSNLLGAAFVFALTLYLMWQFNRRLTRLLERVHEAHAALASAHGRLAEADRMKTQFMNNASHELRTPLTPVRVQLHLLRNPRVAADAPARDRALHVIERNFRRLERLVEDLLDVSRLAADRFHLEPARLDAHDLVTESVDAYRAPARAVGVDIVAASAPGLPVDGDAARLGQVLDNLISNALKFTPRGGRVTVTAAGEDEEVVIAVADTGCGIPPRELARLFNPFEQAAAPIEGRESGVGLGLFISRGIVDAHGGALAAASGGPGEGATFTLRLPRARAGANGSGGRA